MTDNQNPLKAGARGPTLLEDFILRGKITHFDHQRIPERIVHARGSGAQGYFELTHPLSGYTRARVLTETGVRTPVSCRFSTVTGGAGSVDTPRDVRGFALKCYTAEDNRDLAGNNIPLFFIQHAMKFPVLVHAVNREPDRGFPDLLHHRRGALQAQVTDHHCRTGGGKGLGNGPAWAISGTGYQRDLVIQAEIGSLYFRTSRAGKGQDNANAAPRADTACRSIACAGQLPVGPAQASGGWRSLWRAPRALTCSRYWRGAIPVSARNLRVNAL